MTFECTFEEDNALSKFDSLSQCGNNVSIVDSIKRFGKKSVRFFLNYPDTSGCLTLRSQAVKQGGSVSYTAWYGFSVLFSSDYPGSYDGLSSFFQVYRSGTDTTPPLTLNYEGFYTGMGDYPSGKYITVHQNLISPDSVKNQSPYTTYIYPLDTITINKWVDIVAQIKWSNDSSGFVKLWINGKLSFIHSGPNNYSANSLRTGVDKMDWRNKWQLAKSGTRTLYFDEIRIGTELASYIDVLPGGGGFPLSIRDAPIAPTRVEPTPFSIANPIRGDKVQINIPSDRRKTMVYEMFDVSGRSLMRGTIAVLRGSNYKEFDVSRFANGMYFFALQSENGLTVKKLIK